MNRLLPLLTVMALTAPVYASNEPTNALEAAVSKASADPATDAKYAALVATLAPEQQAWERALQQNLGSFYLSKHKLDRVAGLSTAWDFVADDPKLPRVLLIGDSISRGYTPDARKALAGRANVHRAPANCGPTAMGLKQLDIWLGSGKWDLIHFNFGIHDRATPVADYEQRLEQLIGRLQKTGAKLVWASSTPIAADATKYLPAAAIVDRNAIAARLMEVHGIAIDDLYTFITPHLAAEQTPGDVHFKPSGYTLLGGHVAAAIEAALSQPSTKP